MKEEVARAAGTEKRAVQGLILYGGAFLPAVMGSETCFSNTTRPVELAQTGRSLKRGRESFLARRFYESENGAGFPPRLSPSDS